MQLRFRKVNREGAEVTSAGRSFQTRAPATESTTSNSRQFDGRNAQIVRGGRPKSLSGGDVGDWCKLPQVLRGITVQCPVSLHCDLEHNPFRHS